MNEEHELRYWARKLNCSEEQLRDAVKRAGPMVEDVERLLRS